MLAGPLSAGDEDTADMADVFVDGRHRIDLSYTQAEGFDGDVSFVLPAYTYSVSDHLKVTAVTSYVEIDFPASEEFDIPESIEEAGWGDSVIGFQYSPNAKLTSGAWVPDTLGFAASLQIPTGDKDKGLTGDNWVAEVGGGWLLDMPFNFWVIPAVAYRRSFKDGELAYQMNEGVVGVGFYWLFPFRAWLGVEPSLGWDFERDTSIDQFRLYAGKSFSNGLAMEVAWGTQARVEQGAVRDDDVLVFSFSWQFGRAP